MAVATLCLPLINSLVPEARVITAVLLASLVPNVSNSLTSAGVADRVVLRGLASVRETGGGVLVGVGVDGGVLF